MSAQREFRLPDLGEGLTESDIVVWHVAAGDRVELNQVIAEVETAKALVDLPSPYAGVVATLHAQEGQTVNVGDPIVTFEVDEPAAAPGAEPPSPAEPRVERQPEAPTPAEPRVERQPEALSPAEPRVERQPEAHVPQKPGFGTSEGAERPDDSEVVEPNLVGYGARPDRTGRPTRRRRRAAPGAEPGVARQPETAVPHDPGLGSSTGPDGAAAPDRLDERPRSTPPVRALAKKLGVHVERVAGTGPDGLVTRADVLAAVSCHRDVPHVARPTAVPARAVAAVTGAPTVPDAADDDALRVPVRGVRKHTAAAMVSSAFTAPHATVFLTVDVTRSAELLDRLRTHRLARGSRVTVLALAARALCLAVPRHPDLNSAWHDLPDGTAEIWQHRHVDLGIAVATDRGLVVPHVPHADALDLPALADGITELTATARAGRTAPERLAGGTITITNVGVFGVDAGTPILVPGQAAILGLGAVRRRPWEHDGEVALRDVVTLSVSFDHRVVDGEQAARFLADLGALLEDPALALLLGGVAAALPDDAASPPDDVASPPADVARGGSDGRRARAHASADADPAAQPGARRREGAPA
ncbi:dihydrolipoamide acetyltransferase family protein [Cellulosimicrobium sp. NPDC057127]|uniref:dihydrolipoamide acetyltransferase family protein n=1 Tax=Cellulosimicrobium sp. NPDC057127 TaxID=3346026 RepID=UPI0036458256